MFVDAFVSAVHCVEKAERDEKGNIPNLQKRIIMAEAITRAYAKRDLPPMNGIEMSAALNFAMKVQEISDVAALGKKDVLLIADGIRENFDRKMDALINSL